MRMRRSFILVVCLCAAALLWRLPAAGAAEEPKPKPAAPAAAPAPPPPPPLEISTSDKGISIYAEGAQADEVFGMLARVAGVGVIVDDTIGRRDGDKFITRLLTVNLANKTADEIIGYICTAYGFSHTKVGNVYMISEGIPKNPSSYLMSDIDSVTTEYVISSEAKSLLPEFLQAHVKVNDGKNAVVLSAPAEVLQKFRQDIKQFDVPASQIMIDVIMVEFTEAAGRELGFDFLWSNAARSGATSSGSGDVIFRTLASLPSQFTATLRALEQKRLACVHANPRIATVSGQPASVFVGRQRYLSQPVDTNSGTMNYIDAGIKLDMTPWTGGQGEIITNINAEVSVMSALDPFTQLPEKSTRRVTTQVRVRDGETIIVGGLTQTESQATESRIPLLSSLPIVGRLFRSHAREDSTTELVIFITPRLMTDKDRLSDDQRKQLLERFGASAPAPK